MSSGPSPAERYAAARRRSDFARTETAAFAATYDFTFDDFQVQGCRAIEEGGGVLVAAPTGAGKTVVGEFACQLALARGRKTFYTTPIKALSNQKYTDLADRFGVENVGLLTGDTSVRANAPIVVMTTEVLRNMLYAGSDALDGLGYVVMDEVHYLADRFRGSVWEEVIIHLDPAVQIVSLSATVSNAEEFGDWLEMVRGTTRVVVSERRPVPLWAHVAVARATHGVDMLDLYAPGTDPYEPAPTINPELLARFRAAARPEPRRGGDRGYRGRGGRRVERPVASRPSPRRIAVVDALEQARLLPAIYFIFSRAGCEAAVEACVRAGLRLTEPAEARAIERVVDERCAGLDRADLGVLGFAAWRTALSHGIAAHHAGMLAVFRETVEELFARGLVKVVFATETLSLGINMPAKSVILERLVKWDGTRHVAITAGEYTQLTGRAGRRGIDVEGHAIVVDHSGLDPVHLGGLASRRTYPLRSSFAPTYNMAANLVAQVGRRRAREILEMSFAQFQADRSVVDLARQTRAHEEALAGYAQSASCSRGDFDEYLELRRRIKDLERSRRPAGGPVDANAHPVLAGARRGDILRTGAGRYVVVVDADRPCGFEGPAPRVLDTAATITRLTVATASGVAVTGRLRVPASFNPRSAAARRALAGALRERAARLNDAGPAHRDRDMTSLRAKLRAHPCHGCPHREDHARWAKRRATLDKQYQRLLQQVESRTGTIARTFDRICDVLATLGYLTADGETVTADGSWLRRLYAEDDLLLAECVRQGAWESLDAPGLAAAVSTLVYSARREQVEDPQLPGGPRGALARAMNETVRIWSRLDDLEHDHHLDVSGPPDAGLAPAMHRWAAGAGLDRVLAAEDVSAGDFVRWAKQVIDILDQLAAAAPSPVLRRVAASAIERVRRGVVAYVGV